MDQRSDVFSLGAVMYEMVTSTRPFEGNSSAAILDAILHRVPASPRHFNPELSSDLERIITKALDKDRELRYQTVSDLRADLRRLKRELDSGQPATTAAPALATPASRAGPRWRWMAAAIAGVIPAGLLAVSYFRAPLPPPKILRYVQLTSDGRPKLSPYSHLPYVLATDGSRVYFLAPGSGLFQVSAMGGETLPVPTSLPGHNSPRYFAESIRAISRFRSLTWDSTSPTGGLLAACGMEYQAVGPGPQTGKESFMPVAPSYTWAKATAQRFASSSRHPVHLFGLVFHLTERCCALHYSIPKLI